VAFLR